MEHKQHPQTQEEARSSRYVHDFSCNNHGQIYCLASPKRLYSFDEYKAVGVISDALVKCADILIETKDGLCGTLTAFWES